MVRVVVVAAMVATMLVSFRLADASLPESGPGPARGRPLATASSIVEARRLSSLARASYYAGDIENALRLYSEALHHSETPSVLFNLAQVHRKLGHCVEAISFYRRYVEVRPIAANRALVDRHIRLLAAECDGEGARSVSSRMTAPGPSQEIFEGAKSSVEARPDGVANPSTGTTESRTSSSTDGLPSVSSPSDSTLALATEDFDPDASEETTSEVDGVRSVSGTMRNTAPSTSSWSFGLEALGAWMSIGSLEAPLAPSVRASTVLSVFGDRLAFDVGAMASLSAVRYRFDETGTMTIFDIVPSAGATFWAVDWLAIHGKAGVGLTRIAGLPAMNPVTRGDAATAAVLLLGHATVSADVRLHGPVFARLDILSLAYNPSLRTLEAEVDHVLRVAMGAGVALRL